MATTLSAGDIAIVQYNTSTDAFSFVFLRDVEAGTIVNFSDNGWLAAGGFRAGESTATYTAPSAIAAGTTITLSGLDLDEAGDQIIAYQGDPATPTILHLADFADGDNTVAGDATDDNSTALPPGFTLGVNAVAVAFDSSLYAGPTSGSPEGLFAALNNSANWIDADTLPPPFRSQDRPDIDLDADNSTHGGRDYRADVTSGGLAVKIADADIDIGDDDGTEISEAEIKVSGADPGDLLSVNGTLPAGIVASTYDPATGIVTLTGTASHADYETAIRLVEFSTTEPVGEQKKIEVIVFDGDEWSPEGTAFIKIADAVTATDPPVLDLDANNSSGGGADASATFTAGGPATPVADIDVSITDADSTMIESATITIGINRQPDDLLSIVGTLPAGITASSYDSGTGVIRLTGAATLADYQTALRLVAYSSTNPTPLTADRIIGVTVNDGTFESIVATMYMHVVVPPPNIAPVLDLDANNSTTPGANYLTAFTEGAPPVAIADADVSIIDSDNTNLASATITLTNPQAGDVLTFDGTPPAGIAVSGSGTGVITLTGPASSASYQTALQQIKFSNGSIDPSHVTRIVEVVVNDGISNSNTATAIVQVEGVNNSAPVIDLDPNDSSASTRTTFRTIFTENGSSIPIADADVSITDLDSTTLVSATITLENQHPGDLLTVAALPLPGGIVASSYDPGTGVLTLTGVATLDEYEAALQQVLYGNSSDNPITEDRLIEVVVNDGANTSNVAAAVIAVVAVNDAPVIQVDTIATYVENATAIALSPFATLTDVDNTELNNMAVRITGGAISGDGDTLTVGGSTSGTINGITFLWHPADHALVLTGASLVANYQDLLRKITFHSTSDNPTDFNAATARTLTWSVSGGTAVTTTTTTLGIVALNDAPQATVAAAASYTENGAPVVISPASTATDVDDINLVSGEVRIVLGAVAGDLLTVNGLQSGTFSGIEFSYSAILRSLTFTHPKSVADYQAFLQAIEFSSTSDDPTNSGLDPTRTLSWFVFDGDALSDRRTTVLSITALADPPVNTVPGAQTVNEDTALPIAGVSVADVDSPALTTTLTVTSGRLSVTTGGGATILGNGTAVVTLSGSAVQINAALAGLAYTGNLDFNGSDTLTVTTSDGPAQDIDTIAITVNPVNDPPVNTVPGAQTVNEDTALPIAGVSVADVDSPALTTTLTVTSGRLSVTTGGGATILGNGTAVVTLSGSAVQINAALAGLAYTGNLDFNGSDTLTVTTSDGPAQDIDTIAITINPVNDPPVNTVPGAQTVNEDTALPIAGVSVADVDSPALTTTLTVTSGRLSVTTGGGATILGNGTAVVTLSGSAVQINAALAGLAYTGNLDFNGSDTLTVTTSDGPAQDIDTIAITINPVNDPPVNTVPGAQTVNEDTALPIAGVSVADVDSPALTTTLTVTSGRLSVTTGGGATILGNGTAVVTLSGSAVQINAALAGLAYTGNLDFNGSDTLTVTTSDGPAQDIDTIAITINPVNDPPVNTVPGAQTVNEDTALPIAGVSVADVDSPALTTTLTVTSGRLSVTTGGGATILGNGTAVVTLSGSAVQINAALASLAYTGNLDFNGSDTLTVTTSDGPAQDIDTIAITINPVNDPPVNTVPGAQTVNEDTALPIAGVSVADVDSPALTTTLTVTSGRLSVTTGGGATILGNGTAVVTLSGSAVQINAALAGLAYTGNLDFNGSDTLTVTTSDGPAQDIDTIAITVNPVNDPPVNTVPGAQTVNEDTALPIAGVSVADVDSPALTTTLTVTSGRLSVTTGGGATILGNGTAVVTLSGSAVQINAALAGLAYTGNLDFNGSDTLTVTTSDGPAQDIDTIAITVNPVNDPPVNTVPGAQTVNEDTALFIPGLSVADVDSPALTVTLSALNGSMAIVPGLALLAGNLSHTVTISGTLAEVNLALANVRYLGDPDFNGSDTLTVTTSDSLLSDIDAVAITVADITDAPVLDLDAGAPGSGYVTTFTENGLPVALTDIDLVLADDSLTLAAATFLLLNVQAGDALVVTGSLPGAISAVITGNQITLTGDASVDDYAAAMKLIAFNNPGDAPDPNDRLILVTVDDGTSTTSAFTLVHLAVTNDAPVAQNGSASGNEDTPINGTLVATDVDNLTLTYALGAQAANGTVVVNTDGTYTYTPSLNFNGTDSFTFTASDGTAGSNTATVTLTVNPVNDPPVAQNGSASGNEDTPINGTLVATDVDNLTLTYALGAQAANGTVVVNTDGTYTYTPSLNFNGTDSFTFTASDGTAGSNTATVTLTVNPVNDPPVAQNGSASGNEDTPINGTLVATDVDNLTLTYALGAQAANGTVVVNTDGTYTYTPSLNFNGTDSFTFTASDGTADSNTATVTVLVGGENAAPINNLPATFELEANVPAALTGLSVTDDSGAGIITTTLTLLEGILDLAPIAGATVTGSGTNRVTIEGTLAQINATLGAPDNARYTAPRDFFGPDPLIMTTDDHGFTGSGGSKSDTDQSTIFLNTFTGGTTGDDSHHALLGNQYIMTHTGSDTVSFDFALVDATVTFRGHLVIIDGPSSHTVVSGVETYDFTDGEVRNRDDDRLVDDLFYYSHYHDVWNARVDADEHYNVFGTHEGRDPNALFDTSFYLAQNPDVAAAGVDPLRHFDQFGWKEGRLPSLLFDPGAYLTMYPDIAAAQIDPLAHFLAHGMEENRLISPPTGLIAPNGFDYSYYLLHNPDVAAAGVDPLDHFTNFGWKEGRKPNAFFDTTGYLGQYSDVAAAGINPLDHYHLFGWREGRDPSVIFDTGSYLAGYGDVLAADRDPLQHYLQFGIHEGRSTFADGIWG